MNIWQGRRVRLRAVEVSDWEAHFKWDQDSETSRALDKVWFPRSTEKAKRWAEEAAVRTPQNDQFFFQIETLTNELVGSISTHDCEPHNGTFSYGIAIRPEYQRQGFTSEAIALVLRYYFEELRYQKVNAGIYGFNEASIQLHQKFGFVQEGRLRRMIYTQGKYEDLLIYGMTAEEFAGRNE